MSVLSFIKKSASTPEAVIHWHRHKLELVAPHPRLKKAIIAQVDVMPNATTSSLRQSLKTLYSSCKVSPKSAVILCHHPKTVIRLMSLQARPGKQLTEQIAKKMGQYALFSGTEIVSTHIILSEEKSDSIPTQHVLVAAMPREAITPIVAACQLANLRITTILPPPWEMLVSLPKNISSGIVVLIAAQCTLLLKTHHAQIQQLQTLAIGTENDWPSVESALKQHIESFIQRATPVATEVHIYTEKSDWRNDLLNITQSLPTEWIDGEKEGYKTCDHYASLATGQHGNLVAALPLHNNKKLWIHFLGYMIGISFLLLCLFFVIYKLNNAVQNKISSVQKDLKKMQSQYQQVTGIHHSLSEAKEIIQGRQKLLADRHVFDWQLFFAELPTMLTRSIRIERVNGHEDGHLYLEGKAASSEDVFAFLKQLKSRSYLGKIQLQEVIQEKESGMVRFSIKTQRTQL